MCAHFICTLCCTDEMYTSSEQQIKHTLRHQLNVYYICAICFYFLSMGPVVSHKQTEGGCADLTDVTLADEDTNPILTDKANRAIQGNVAWQCK